MHGAPLHLYIIARLARRKAFAEYLHNWSLQCEKNSTWQRRFSKHEKLTMTGKIICPTQCVACPPAASTRERLALSFAGQTNSAHIVYLDSLRGSSVKIGTIQRRLAWPLRKDDTHKSRMYHFWILRFRNLCEYWMRAVMSVL